MEYSIALSEVVRQYHLIQLNPQVKLAGIYVTHSDINRPALQIAGFFDYFDSHRIQILGRVEHAYLEQMNAELRRENLKRMFMCGIPCLIICRNLLPCPEMLELATECNVPIFSTNESTTEFMGEIIRWLRVQLAPRATLHGVLVDIYGEGVLIMGESGIGKSETALELIKRGHRLVADDAVEVKRVSAQTIIGSSPEIIRYLIELRGIGIIDVRQMFGVESIKAIQNVDLVIKLELWDDTTAYDRLGLSEEFMEILGNRIVCHKIPIRPGRNIAVICESAAINHRQKKMGHNVEKVLNERISANIQKNGGSN